MRVYEAQLRAKAANASWALDVPSPDIKHRILGNILELHLDICEYSEMIHMVNYVSLFEGCKDDAVPLYRDAITNNTYKKAEKRKSEGRDFAKNYEAKDGNGSEKAVGYAGSQTQKSRISLRINTYSCIQFLTYVILSMLV